MSNLQSQVSIYLDDAKRYDEALHGTDMRVLQDSGDLSIITKHGATQTGRAGACLTFTVDLNGKLARAQTVVSVRILKVLLRALDGKYDDEGMPR